MNKLSVQPCCIHDLKIYQEKFLGKKKYFMVSEMREKYLKLTESQYNFFSIIKEYMDGRHSMDEIDEKVRSISGGIITAESVVDSMYKNNLLEEQYEEPKSRVELELSGKKIFELSMGKFQEKCSKGLELLDKLINCLGTVTIIYTLYLIVFNMPLIRVIIAETGKFSWADVSPGDFLIIAALSILAIPIHEIGHLMAANRYGVRWKSLTLMLRWGVNPIYYIKYYNFYTNSSKNKVMILLGGVYYNLIQASVYFILLVVYEDWKMAVMSIINLGCILSCLLPSGTSDGYHIISLLLGIEGIRWKMVKLVSTIVKKPQEFKTLLRHKENIGLIAYFLISYGIGIYGCYILLITLLDYLHIFLVNPVIISALFTVWIIISVIINVIKFGNNLKQL